MSQGVALLVLLWRGGALCIAWGQVTPCPPKGPPQTPPPPKGASAQ